MVLCGRWRHFWNEHHVYLSVKETTLIEKSRNGDEESDVLTGVQLFSSSDQYHSSNKGQLAISHWRPASDYWRCSEQDQRERVRNEPINPKTIKLLGEVKSWIVILYPISSRPISHHNYGLQQVWGR